PSKNDIKVGEAAITPNRALSITLPGEMFAIREAIKHIKDTDTRDWIILTDSLQSLKMKEELHEVLANENVDLQWVPSHVGIEGNELADQNAKAALNGVQQNNMLLPATYI
ncbi:hypothetical protein WA026_014245, partial [Henosepilachna vigintioctopunctata]